MKDKKKAKVQLGGLRPDSIADVRPNDLQKGLGGSMSWEMRKKGSVKQRASDKASRNSAY